MILLFKMSDKTLKIDMCPCGLQMPPKFIVLDLMFYFHFYIGDGGNCP